MKYVPKYKVFPKSNHDESSRESFCRVLGGKLASNLRPKLKTLYEKKLQEKLFSSLGREPNHKEIAKLIRSQLEGKIGKLNEEKQKIKFQIIILETVQNVYYQSKKIKKYLEMNNVLQQGKNLKIVVVLYSLLNKK